MDAKEISAFLTPPKLTARETLLAFTGAAIALLLAASGNGFYQHDYRHGIWCFVAALVLGFVFFRKRKLALVEGEARELIKKRPYGPWLFR